MNGPPTPSHVKLSYIQISARVTERQHRNLNLGFNL